MEYYIPVVKWKALVNAAALFAPMDYWMNKEEIDEQIIAQKEGWA